MVSVEGGNYPPKSDAYYHAREIILDNIRGLDSAPHVVKYIQQVIDTMYNLGYNQGRRTKQL